jgi:uncharacterized RDD family membrane protein YckC
MGYPEGVARSASVPPPGWTATGPPAAPTASAAVAARPTTGSSAADAAVRWRLGAATIDSLVVYVGYLGVCALLHWRVADINHLLVLLIGGVAYHFLLEARDGQTIGKRRYGIRVVSVDGGTPTPGAIAIRSALRIFDQLPVAYVSGLVSMVRTGPARRQRMGDVAAGTMVIATGGRAVAKGTPGWYLPAATIFAVLLSAATFYAVAEAGKQPLTSAQTADFIAGCERSAAAQLVSCTCLLNQLEADGHVTLSGLRALVAEGQAERLAGRPGPSTRTLTAAALACRR